MKWLRFLLQFFEVCAAHVLINVNPKANGSLVCNAHISINKINLSSCSVYSHRKLFQTTISEPIISQLNALF